MKRTDLTRLLPHEILFGIFMLITWVRLGVVAGFGDRDALVYLVLLGVNGALTYACCRKETRLLWRLRLLFYPLAMNLIFFQMKVAIPKIHPLRLDAFLQHVDSFLVGANLSVRLQPITHPALTEFFSICYILFFPYLVFSMVACFCGDLDVLKKFFTGLFSIYGLGFLGYSFVPAAGPWVALADQFTVPLTGGWFTAWNAAIVRAGSNGVDVFPSLHCAVSCYLLLFDRQYRPWRFRLYLLPCLGLWCSTIYLRYHYAIDLLCGFALAALALWLVRQPAQKHELHADVPRTTGDQNRT